jgi:hypothetical protein
MVDINPIICFCPFLAAADQVLLRWSPRSPDLMPCNFFLWGYVKDCVFLPLLPQDLPELRRWIIAAISEIDHDKLQWVWAETDYQLDICSVTKGRHIENLWDMEKNLGVSFPSVGHMLNPFCHSSVPIL